MASSGEYDLGERTLKYAQAVRRFVRELPKTISNFEDVKQLVRASGSVGANYIEADEALSKKDFIYRIKVCRKEAKESRYYLQLVATDDETARDQLVKESTELLLIFNAIIRKSE